MPVLITSDIHGSRDGILLLQKAVSVFRPEKIISAGDQCPVPGYEAFFSSMEMTRGNCDRFYEYDNLRFPPLSLSTEACGHRITVTHGDRMYEDDFNLAPGDIFITGHTHVPHLEVRNGIYFCNPGSSSRPRSSSGPTAALLSEEGISIFSLLSSEILDSLSF